MMRKRVVEICASPGIRPAVMVALLLCAVACSDDPSSSGPTSGDNAVANDLSFVRQDDSPVAMGADYAICCGIWEEGYIDKNTLKIFLYDSRIMSDPENADSFWKLFIIVDEVAVGRPYAFPTANDSPVKVFLFDITTGNELSGDADDSVGTITIESFDCGPPLKVSVTVDATIGSEFFQGPVVHMTGSFSATVFSNPSPLRCDFAM